MMAACIRSDLSARLYQGWLVIVSFLAQHRIPTAAMDAELTVDCYELVVSSAEYYRHLEGAYHRLPLEKGCGGLSVWRRPVPHLAPHIEYLYIYSPPTTTNWVISHLKCDTSAFARLAVEVKSPHLSPGKWREAKADSWPQHYSTMNVSCTVYDQACEVGEWGDWAPCSLSCGHGTRWRFREVQIPALGHGSPCPSLHLSQVCLGRSACPRTDTGPSNDDEHVRTRAGERQPLPPMMVTRGPENLSLEHPTTSHSLVEYVVVPLNTQDSLLQLKPSPRYKEVIDKSSPDTKNDARTFSLQGFKYFKEIGWMTAFLILT